MQTFYSFGPLLAGSVLFQNNMKNSLSQSVFLVVVFILFSPHESQADAINPIFNLFTPDTVVPASILTVLIILVETLLLWKWIKPISFRLSLRRATIINIISSAVGSIAAWLFFQEQMIWEMMGLYIPMFFLTLATETPTLKFLYRQSGLDWERSIKVSFGLNFFSYLFVFITQFVLIFAYVVGYANFADKQTIRKWNDVSLLEGETGFIYTVKDAHTENFKKYVFNRYDVENKKWEIVDPGFERGIYPAVWDAKGNLIACIIETGESKNRPITVINATTFLKLAEIDGNFREARISPDLSKLAVFDYVREINAPRDDKSAFMLGSGCELKIYDIESGSLLHEAPRLALDMGLTWTNNSTIIFASLREESLLKNSEADTPKLKYGRGSAKPGQFPIDLFIYDLRTKSVGSLVEGQGPQFIPSNNEISFVRESEFYNREIWQTSIEQKNPRLVLGNIQGYETAVSPSGRKYLILVPHKQPLVSSYFLTLVDPNDQGKRLIIEPNSHYGFRWIGSQVMTKALAKPTSEHRQLDDEVIRPINHDPGPSRSDGSGPQSRTKRLQPNPDNASFLQACRKGDIETIKRRLDRDIDLNPISMTRKVALVEAAKGQHIEIMNLLLEKGADINLLDSSEKSALMTASESGSLAAVRFLIQKGADLDTANTSGSTALGYACLKAHYDIAKLLIENGSNVNFSYQGKATPIFMAAYSGRLELVKLLVKNGADIHARTKQGNTVLTKTSNQPRGALAILEYLIEQGSDINDKNKMGYSPLMDACRAGREEVVNFLLEKGADVESSNKYGETPLMIAAGTGNFGIVKALVAYNAEIHAKDKHGNTALLKACGGSGGDKKIKVIKFLLNKGANVNHKDSLRGWSGLMIASSLGFIKTVNTLIAEGAEIDVDSDSGDTALSLASRRGHIEVVKILLEKGADVSWEDLIFASRKFLRRGKYSEAAYSGQEALKVVEKKFGPNHPKVSKALSNLANIYVAQGEYLKADQHCQRCIKINEKIFGKDHLKVAEALTCLSSVYQAQGKYEEAEQISLRIFKTKKDGFWKDYPQAPYLGFYFENCNEPSIYYFKNQPGVECYRFTSISLSPGGGHRFVRIMRNKSSIKLYTDYRAKNAKNSSWHLASRDLKEEEWKTLTDAISNRAFWDLSNWDPFKGFDGYYTILEGVNKGRYHLVERWAPSCRTSERGLNELNHAYSLFRKLLEIK